MTNFSYTRFWLLLVAWFAMTLTSYGDDQGGELSAMVFHDDEPFRIQFFLSCEIGAEVVILLTLKGGDNPGDRLILRSFRNEPMGATGVGISVFLGGDSEEGDEWKTPFKLERHGRYNIKFCQLKPESEAEMVLAACDFEYGEATGIDFVRINLLGKN